MILKYFKSLCTAAFFSLFCTSCAAQSQSVIPDTLNAGQQIDFKTIASQISNPCPEEELSSYKTLWDVLENGKNCHEAYILSFEIEFYLSHSTGAARTESIVKAQAKQMLSPNVFVTKDRPRLGKESAPVEVVVFSDFQCPFCARAAKNLHRVYSARPDAVSIVFKNMPLQSIHPYAAAAALIAAYAHQKGKFWDVHDKIFESQSSIGPDFLSEILKELGADPAELFDPEKGQALGVTVVEDLKDAVYAEVSGTPTFFVNGVEIQSGSSFDYLTARIDAEISAPPAVSPEVRERALSKTVADCPYPGLESEYAKLSTAQRLDLAKLANSAVCSCPDTTQSLYDCASSCESARLLISYMMMQIQSGMPLEDILMEMEAYIKKERTE